MDAAKEAILEHFQEIYPDDAKQIESVIDR
jgi:hypothetical protein